MLGREKVWQVKMVILDSSAGDKEAKGTRQLGRGLLLEHPIRACLSRLSLLRIAAAVEDVIVQQDGCSTRLQPTTHLVCAGVERVESLPLPSVTERVGPFRRGRAERRRGTETRCAVGVETVLE